MARVEQAIYNILSNATEVTDIVSTRIYPSFVPQDKALPALTYERTSSLRHFSMGTDPEVGETKFEIAAISTSLTVVGDLANKVRIALSRHTGTYASVGIKDIYIDEEIQTYFSDLETYEIVMSYSVLHNDTT